MHANIPCEIQCCTCKGFQKETKKVDACSLNKDGFLCIIFCQHILAKRPGEGQKNDRFINLFKARLLKQNIVPNGTIQVVFFQFLKCEKITVLFLRLAYITISNSAPPFVPIFQNIYLVIITCVLQLGTTLSFSKACQLKKKKYGKQIL